MYGYDFLHHIYIVYSIKHRYGYPGGRYVVVSSDEAGKSGEQSDGLAFEGRWTFVNVMSISLKLLSVRGHEDLRSTEVTGGN